MNDVIKDFPGWPPWPLYRSRAGDLLPVNELLAANYRARLAAGNAKGVALLLAERDTASYLRSVQAERTEIYDPSPAAFDWLPAAARDWLFGSAPLPGGAFEPDE